MTISEIICLFPIILLATFWSCQAQTCEDSFLVEPSSLNNSTLDCNIEGRPVEIKCQIQVVGFQIQWLYTKNQSKAGSREQDTLLNVTTTTSSNCGSDQICAITASTSSTFTSTLTINPFNNTEHSGFYWCERTAAEAGSNVTLPSQIVNIHANYTQAELASCSSGIFFFFNVTDASISSCAFGEASLRMVWIVQGVEFVVPAVMSGGIGATTIFKGEIETTTSGTEVTRCTKTALLFFLGIFSVFGESDYE